MSEPRLLKLSTESVGKSSLTTSPVQMNYALASMLWNLQQQPPNRMSSFYRPVRFVPGEKLTVGDKLLLAFDALAFSRVTGKLSPNGKIIHGSKYRAAVIPLTKLVGKARTILGKMAARRAETTPPLPVLNKYCAGCEFRSYCQQIASEKDDLSLLATLTAKEGKKQNDKGIFTVTQLSYLFRPRRSPARTFENA